MSTQAVVRSSVALVGLLVLGTMAASGAAAASHAAAVSRTAESAISLRACRKGSIPPAANPQPACIHGPWATPYATPINGSASLTRSYVARSALTGCAHWLFHVRITYNDPLSTCPEPTPLQDIPCQEPGQNFPGYGDYVQGKSELQPGFAAGGGGAGATCTNTAHSGTCVVTFPVYTTEYHGTFVVVWGVVVGDLTKNPANDQGQAGFQFLLTFSAPLLPK